MDLLSSSVTETMISSLNGLSLRHKVISANIANANTPDFQRQDVIFEDQLKEALQVSKLKQKAKEHYSAGLTVNPLIPGIHNAQDHNYSPFDNVNPKIMQDYSSPVLANGNNVNIEQEMVELTKNGAKYTIVAELLGKKFKGMSDIIKQAGS